jgi:hypothetical protein
MLRLLFACRHGLKNKIKGAHNVLDIYIFFKGAQIFNINVNIYHVFFTYRAVSDE